MHILYWEPGMLRTGAEGMLRLSVTNSTDTTATDISLELIVPGSWGGTVG